MVVSPPAKRQRTATCTKTAAQKAGISNETMHIWSALHQFSLVGGLPPPEGYEPKQRRLEQILERLPSKGGSAVVFVEQGDICEVKSIVQRYCRSPARAVATLDALASLKDVDSASNASTRASTNCSDTEMSPIGGDSLGRLSDFGADAGSDTTSDSETVSSKPPTVHVLMPTSLAYASLRDANCQYVINYSLPASGRKYMERFTRSLKSSAEPHVVFTLVEEEELPSRRCREVVGLLRRAKQAALKHEAISGMSKVAELDSCLQQLEPDYEEFEADEDDEDDDDRCQCNHCQSYSMASLTYHASGANGSPRVEAVHIHVAALENMQALSPLIQPRFDHVCTIISLHCLYEHAPWAGFERGFALPDGMGTVRVVFLLAEEGSWHNYPDTGTFYGGSAWIDILDMNSMDKTDKLVERLVDHEIELLKGRSDRIVLHGVSQGGGQSMLRFLRSRQPLGGWVGGVCHVPTAPHTPRDRDPLTEDWCPLANRDRPVRLLSGGRDAVFPPATVLRDAERLRTIGGFSDVQVEVQPELSHEGWAEAMKAPCKSKMVKKRKETPSEEASMQEYVPDLLYLRRHLPSMIGLVSS